MVNSKSALAEWVEHEEATLTRLGSVFERGVPFHKVTLRLPFDPYVRLRLLAERYASSATSIGERAFAAALVDACELAGITDEQVTKRAEEEYALLEEKHKVTPLTHTLAVEG